MASTWAHGVLTGYDLESTGVDVENDLAVTASVIHVVPGHDPDIRSWLIDPGIEIPAGATEIHGITTEHVREHGRPAAQVWPEIADLMAQWWTPGDPLVAYNGSYDLTMSDRELIRHGLPGIEFGDRVMIDPLVISRALHRYVKGGHKLATVCGRYGVELTSAHNSDADTLATLRLAYKMAVGHPGSVGTVPLRDLAGLQAGWHASWCRRTSEFLEGQAVKLESAWYRKTPPAMKFITSQFAYLEITEQPSDEVIARVVAETRATVKSIAASASDWPMRARPEVSECIVNA
jgi:DNA polymerase-3 subunit epsilon